MPGSSRWLSSSLGHASAHLPSAMSFFASLKSAWAPAGSLPACAALGASTRLEQRSIQGRLFFMGWKKTVYLRASNSESVPAGAALDADESDDGTPPGRTGRAFVEGRFPGWASAEAEASELAEAEASADAASEAGEDDE